MKALKIHTTQRRQKGATLLEALAFLGIAAIVIVGAIAMFRSAQSNDMVQQLSGLRGNIKTLFSSQAQYGPASGAAGNNALGETMINAKALPDTLRVTGTAPARVINNAWSGVVQVDGNTSDFWIRYTNVPQEVCVKVAPQTGAAWVGLTINANTEVLTDTAVFPVATATTQCNAGNPNTMTWRGR